MPSLSELLAMPGDDRPETTTTVTLIKGQHLINEERRLVDEHNDILAKAEQRARDAEEGNAGPRKSAEGGGSAERLEELKGQIAAIQSRLAELQGDVGLVGFDAGEWQRYKDDHPPRKDSRDDQLVGGGWVNATDLLNDLGLFVRTWDGEPLAEGNWDMSLAKKVTPADLAQLVRDVVAMHQSRLPRAPKAPTSPSTGSAGSA